ncbi:MAG: hypothetical protein ACRDXX_11990 [Stackebrandtia sp.]
MTRHQAQSSAHAELAEELTRLTTGRLLDPLEILLESDRAVDPLRRQVEADARRWASVLLGEDDAAAAGMAVRIMAALYPGDTPFEPSPQWWRTPLGRVTARRAGHPSRRHVSFSVAGAMLGITRQGVGDLVNRGKLTRHPYGGETLASIRQRLEQLARHPDTPTSGGHSA